jgi:uncharacterized repeat protein (TIGR03847 family)
MPSSNQQQPARLSTRVVPARILPLVHASDPAKTTSTSWWGALPNEFGNLLLDKVDTRAYSGSGSGTSARRAEPFRVCRRPPSPATPIPHLTVRASVRSGARWCMLVAATARKMGPIMGRRHEYPELTVLEAEAIGQPGQRRFRLIAGVGLDLVSLWMEKEQLQALGLAIEQLFEQLRLAGLVRSRISEQPAARTAPLPPDLPEYVVGKMAIGYDEEHQRIAIFAHDIEQDEDDDPVFAGRASLPAAKALARQIAQVIAAGRPRCPRCGAVIGPEGHVCPHDNGHLPLE